MVCGVTREPSQWVKAPVPSQGKIGHMKGAIPQFWLPEILGSSPRLEQDNEIARALHAAMRACFPHDVEVVYGRSQPQTIHHSFVLQQDSSHTLYGIALRVWSRADEKRSESIRSLRKRCENDYFDAAEDIYWIPYCLSFLSRYPLYDLLGDYLKGMWIHWNKVANLFHAEEVSRILSFPAPRLNDLVRIDMKDYALCYQFPASPTGFQNFSLWPLFTCLSIPNIVGIVEAAVSSTRRIIFVSHYPAMLTIAAETIRFCVRVYEWSGLYEPVVHARHVTELVQEPGPYILGVTAECRTLFTAPVDALVVDLDRNFVLTSSPPTSLTAGQRTKMINRLTQALNGEVTPSGVPTHLRYAYGCGKLVPAGKIIVMRGHVESIQDPEWWNQNNIMTVMDHVCGKLGRNTGVKAIFGGTVKKPLMTKVSMRHLNEIVRERNQYSRDTVEAWQDYINLKGRLDTEVSKVARRNNLLNEQVECWKQQFVEFQLASEQLTKETQDLKVKIESHKRENRRLAVAIEQQKDDSVRLTHRLAGTEKQRDDALTALILQQDMAERLERERKRIKRELANLLHTNKNIIRQREEAQRVVVHLHSLINGQTHHMEHIVGSLGQAPELSDYTVGSGTDDSKDNRSITPSGSRRDLGRLASRRSLASLRRTASRQSHRSFSPAGNLDGKTIEGEKVTPEMESRFFNSPTGSKNKRLSDASLVDIADRHLREKTDAITNIIRNISEQCAAAVEGLQLAHNAEHEEEVHPTAKSGGRVANSSEDEEQSVHTEGSVITSESGYEGSTYLSPSYKHSSVPPTPGLEHDRASTSMSVNSLSTTPDRSSQQYTHGLAPKIAEGDDESEKGSETGTLENSMAGKASVTTQNAISPLATHVV
ncbi:hypothetical protein MMC13_001116 [Lambiella insularis]|nr:hypothetical protein [Lambiella insularis]